MLINLVDSFWGPGYVGFCISENIYFSFLHLKKVVRQVAPVVEWGDAVYVLEVDSAGVEFLFVEFMAENCLILLF